MPSNPFFTFATYAVVGNSDLRPFPRAIYRALREAGKTVHPVDLGGSRYVEGDEAFASLVELPERVDGAVVELPRHKLLPLVKQAVDAKIPELWLCEGDSPEVATYCREHGLKLHAGDPLSHLRPSWFRRLFGRG